MEEVRGASALATEAEEERAARPMPRCDPRPGVAWTTPPSRPPERSAARVLTTERDTLRWREQRRGPPVGGLWRLGPEGRV